MTTDKRTNGLTAEQILVDEWIRQADRSRSMTGMDAIWFPDAEETLTALRDQGLLSDGAPSEQQVERAAKALASREPMRSATAWENLHEFERSGFRESALAALVAAQGAAPQAESEHEHLLKARALHQTNAGLPSSGVDEDALRPFLKNLIFQYNQERVTLKTATRYLAEWLKGQGRGSEM